MTLKVPITSNSGYIDSYLTKLLNNLPEFDHNNIKRKTIGYNK